MSLSARLREHPLSAASPDDLLAVGLSRRESDADDLALVTARNLMARYQGLAGIAQMDRDVLKQEAGLDDFEAERVLALLELGRRVGQSGPGERQQILEAQDIMRYLRAHIGDRQESVWLFTLDAKLHLIRKVRVHVGTANSAPFGTREILRESVRDGATAIAVAHNHPSGDPEPSPEDMRMTQELKTLCDVLDIQLVDHLVFGSKGYVSFQRRGYL